MNFESMLTTVQPLVIGFGFKLIGALAAWFVGRWLIGIATRLLARVLERQKIDVTIIRYLVSFVAVALTVVLVVALLGFFGIETTSFAALLAAAGFAIGAAWSGLLANFAAGVFLLILRPFKVGDYVNAGGIEGAIVEVGLFASTINTPDNVRTTVGNNKILAADIKNFSANAYRRVDLTAQLDHSTDHSRAMRLLADAIAKVPNVLATPAPDVELLAFNEYGPQLAVRPYCNNNDYWQVYFDVNRVIRETLGAAGFAVAERHVVLRRPLTESSRVPA